MLYRCSLANSPGSDISSYFSMRVDDFKVPVHLPACCQPYHAAERLPPTAEAVMQARFSASVKQKADFLVGHTSLAHFEYLDPVIHSCCKGVMMLSVSAHAWNAACAAEQLQLMTGVYFCRHALQAHRWGLCRRPQPTLTTQKHRGQPPRTVTIPQHSGRTAWPHSGQLLGSG